MNSPYPSPSRKVLVLKFVAGFICVSALDKASAGEVIQLGLRRELFVDHYLIERLQGVSLKLHEPQLAEISLKFDLPWEGAYSGYATVIPDGKVYRLYYRGLPIAGLDGAEAETTCYAESRDGMRWVKPKLGLYVVHGTRENNVVLHGHAPASHNFSPFPDTRPSVAAAERFKALGGTQASGLFGFVSADGIHWKKLRDEPLITKGAFDSQNVAFWSESENCYLLYFRTFTEGEFRGFRTVSRTTSQDFRQWTDPVEMSFGSSPREHLYTSQTHPYFRARHIYIATPMRFVPNRQVLSDAQAQVLGVGKSYFGDCADAVFMTSRGGNRFDRTFMEAWIRPGVDLGNWASRAGMTALGVVPTGSEMSIYKQANYAQATAHLVRYTLRLDGFASLHAPYVGGEALTKSIEFSGKELAINFATSAAGSIRVEIQDGEGKQIDGYRLDDCPEIIGDDTERVVAWKRGSDLSKLAGKPVRLRFEMKDADLYSLCFHAETGRSETNTISNPRAAAKMVPAHEAPVTSQTR